MNKFINGSDALTVGAAAVNRCNHQLSSTLSTPTILRGLIAVDTSQGEK